MPMAFEWADHDAGRLLAAIAHPFAEQARLALAQRGQLVVVVGAETGLAVAHEMDEGHQARAESMAARQRAPSRSATAPNVANWGFAACPSRKRR